MIQRTQFTIHHSRGPNERRRGDRCDTSISNLTVELNLPVSFCELTYSSFFYTTRNNVLIIYSFILIASVSTRQDS